MYRNRPLADLEKNNFVTGSLTQWVSSCCFTISVVSLLLLISCVRNDFLAILVALLLLTLPRHRGDDMTSACNFLKPLPSRIREEVNGMLRLIAQAEGILTLSCCLHHSKGNCVYHINIYTILHLYS